MAIITVLFDNEWRDIYAYKKDNHWYNALTHELIKPEFIYNVKD